MNQAREFRHAPQMLVAVFRAETEIGAQAVAHVVAVEHISLAAQRKQLALDFMGGGRFARARQAGEPDHGGLVAVRHFALFARNQRRMPDNLTVVHGGDLLVKEVDILCGTRG